MERPTGRDGVAVVDVLPVILGDRRPMSLIQPSPEGFKLASRFQVPRGGKGPFFAHPVICGGRLYVRHADRLYAYEIEASPR